MMTTVKTQFLALDDSTRAVTATTKESARPPSFEFSKEIHIGIVSQKPKEFFRSLQEQIDKQDAHERCQRYGFTPNDNQQPR